MPQMISSGAIIPLDDLIKNAPNLLKSIPQQQWNTNKFNNKIYGIPLGHTQGQVGGIMIRGDLREKYGLPKIKTNEDIKNFLYAVKKNNPEMIPFGAEGRNAGFASDTFNPFNGDGVYHGIATNVPLTYINAQDKVVPLWEQDGFQDAMKNTTQLYKDGIFEKNVMMQENTVQMFNEGKVGAVLYFSDGVEGLKYQEALKKGFKEEIVMIGEGKGAISSFKQWNFLSIPKVSKHPELVIAFADWVSIKENHDLVEYGIEGKNWTPTGEDSYKIMEGSQYSFPGYVLTWRPGMTRTPDTMTPDDKKWYKWAQNPNNFATSKAAGFTVNTDSIKSEVAKLSPLYDTIFKPLAVGVLTADKGLDQLKKEAKAAGIDTIISEIQKQYDAFRANQ
ncbi:Bacterial extracellular solute-binding protein [compost metagenome]